ncbi:hypothetical protein F5I97DRAFT_1969734 [Phlebopus sp. FC_14]|nr:hypothetical protein F5I97DRAFT_1969734 [Phlebopus sp. FC_14]
MDSSPRTDTAPDNLEKACCQSQPLLQNAAYHQCPPRYSQYVSNRQSTLKRFFLALGAAALVWLTLSSASRMARFCLRGISKLSPDDEVGYPEPVDGKIHDCVNGGTWSTYYDHPSWSTSYPYGAESAFSLPVDADALYTLSRGMYQLGQVDIVQSSEATDTVEVRIRVSYFTDEALDRASVCRMERIDNQHGVGIFTPKHQRRHETRDQLRFDVKITLPAGSDGSPLRIKHFDTNMPNYVQKVANLWDAVVFDEIDIKSSNGLVKAQSVTFELGSFSSVNGAIEGHFNAGSSLNIQTANGVIQASVTLLNREGAQTSKLGLLTANGNVHAEVALASEAGVGGAFDVEAQTSNGAIALAFTDSPVDSLLNCRVSATTGNVHVALHSAYEGSYSMRSTIGNQDVEVRDVEDPAGRGRRRVVSRHRTRNNRGGSVYWVDSDGSSSGTEGSVEIKTTLSLAKLIV